MNKADLVEQIAASSGIGKAVVALVVETFMQ